MEKAELEQYVKLKREARSLLERVDRLRSREVPIVSGKVQASAKDFPWTQVRTSVQMYDPRINDEINKAIDLLRKRIERCDTEMVRVERFIDGIQDSELRQIFQMRYIDGMKLQKIAEQMNMERSGIGKKINAYLKLSHNSQNNVL